MGVPTTHTAADANLERKQIKEEIVTLTQTRDRLREETGLYERANAAVKREIAANGGLVGDTKAYDSLITGELVAGRDALIKEIAGLTSKRDAHAREQGVLAIDTPKKRAEHDKLVADIGTLKSELNTLTVAHNQAVATNSITSGQKQEELAALLVKIQEAEDKLAQVEATEAEKIKWIGDEETRLANKGADLAIYEARIRKMAVAVGMDPSHIVVE